VGLRENLDFPRQYPDVAVGHVLDIETMPRQSAERFGYRCPVRAAFNVESFGGEQGIWLFELTL
jgi:hypothetical protein